MSVMKDLGIRRRDTKEKIEGIVGIVVMMIDIAEIITVITERGISLKRRRRRRYQMHFFLLKFQCRLYKYLCLLFLEKNANEKDQDPHSTTTVGIRTIIKESFGIHFHGCQG